MMPPPISPIFAARSHTIGLPPDLAKQSNIEGKVTVNVLVGTDGRVVKAEVAQGVPVLNEARLGYDVLAVVGVKIHKGKLLEVQRRIAKDDRVTHVYDVTGEWDFVVTMPSPEP